MPNLVFVRLAGTRPHIGEIVTPGVYFFTFFLFLLFDVLAHLHRSHRLTFSATEFRKNKPQLH